MGEQTTLTMESPNIRSAADSAVIRLESVHKTYDLGEIQVHALRGVSLEI